MESMISTNCMSKGVRSSEEAEESSWSFYLQDSIIASSAKKQRLSSVDDELEDTATSPDNTPKVANSQQAVHFHHLYMESNQELQKLKKQQQDDENHTDLRRKGLCLVPIPRLIFNCVS